MISTIRINTELLRCINIRYKFIELYTDSVLTGQLSLIHKYAKDILTLNALEKALSKAVYYSFTETEIELLISNIREYVHALELNSIVDYFTIKYPNMPCPTNIQFPFAEPNTDNVQDTTDNTTDDFLKSVETSTEWRSQILSITSNGQTTITGLNFSIGNVDVDSVLLEVQGDDPDYTTTGDGYHIIGSTLYWHNFYDLRVGMVVKIRWRT